jgi:hypothetical protein
LGLAHEHEDNEDGDSEMSKCFRETKSESSLVELIRSSSLESADIELSEEMAELVGKINRNLEELHQ